MVLHIDLYAVVLQLRAWCKALIVLLMLEDLGMKQSRLMYFVILFFFGNGTTVTNVPSFQLLQTYAGQNVPNN